MNKRRTSKAFRVRAAMTLLLLLLTSATAWADKGYNYIANGQERNTYIDDHIPDGNVTVLSGGNTTEFGTNGGSYWYVVTGIDVEYNEWLTFNGNTNLILADGASITITGVNGIVVDGNLTIYGQSEGTGSLSVKAQGDGSTSGDGILAKNGKITINGGILSITADWYGITTANNDITINGGKITVTSTGENGIDATGNITITGGTVIANATTYGMAATGNITLGCTKDTDYIIANNYNKNININSGLSPLIVYIDTENPNIKNPTTYNNQATITPSVINNKIIAPDLFGISKGNTGTSSNPYTISTAGGLQLLAAYVNSGTIFDYYDVDTQAYDVYTGKYFMITDDIIFDTTIKNNFTPIGDQSHIFQGTFNGGGHIIRGINIYTDKRYVGLFGHLGKEETAMITNVTLANASISIIGDNLLYYTGGIVGHNNRGKISNCIVANTRITKNTTGTSYLGAIAGLNEGTLDHNYYGNSTVIVNDENISSGIGCGTDAGSSDVNTNDGAVSATILSDSKNVPSDLSGKVFFYREFTGGKASTICLPFAYTPKNSDGAFYTFDGIKKNGTTYEATMTVVTSTSLNPNMPYLFVPAGNNTIKPVLFHGTAAYDASELTDTKTPWTFIGTYSRLTYGTAPFSDPVYGFAAKTKDVGVQGQEQVEAGEFVRAITGAYIPPMRCFLKYNTTSTRGETEKLPDHIAVKLVGDPTSIGTLNTQTGEVTFDGWYSLDGQRFNTKPTKKGLYIYKGIKVTIK